MSEDSAGWLGAPGSIRDSLTDLLRRGARGLLEKAVEAELQGLLDQYENVIDLAGRQAVVRNGYLPERVITSAVDSSGPLVKYRTSPGVGSPVSRSSVSSRRRSCRATAGLGSRMATVGLASRWITGIRNG